MSPGSKARRQTLPSLHMWPLAIRDIPVTSPSAFRVCSCASGLVSKTSQACCKSSAVGAALASPAWGRGPRGTQRPQPVAPEGAGSPCLSDPSALPSAPRGHSSFWGSLHSRIFHLKEGDPSSREHPQPPTNSELEGSQIPWDRGDGKAVTRWQDMVCAMEAGSSVTNVQMGRLGDAPQVRVHPGLVGRGSGQLLSPRPGDQETRAEALDRRH